MPTSHDHRAKRGRPDRERLPVLGQPRPERSDAARSRRLVLDAAQRLLAERGPRGVTMNEVAAAAGVGVGTVYRRFGDLPRLLHAVLDDQERALQQRLLIDPAAGAAGGTPTERVTAFLHGYLDHVEAHADLLYEADTAAPGTRFRYGAYDVYHQHLARLVAAARQDLDPDYTADLLLAAVDAELYVTQRRDAGFPAARIKAGLAAVVDALLGGA